jgi:cyclopropane-fatty-acyl-phospholipid synthase
LRQRIAGRTGIHIRLADGRSFGPAAGPALDVADPWAFFSRLGRDGKIGFGEAYMAGEWDSPELVAVLEVICSSTSLGWPNAATTCPSSSPAASDKESPSAGPW